ncbi:hypothetical protein [Paenibacillus campinasensis]|uniref:Phage-Barnase-EndoU-ColicinE5/D-RelE like nuclease 3 domain-containing protein n=1 Tax=Paenibacillus campinasensis TaxID=66347 RepID=A0A268EID0_9BACL|nr:hypothetical protein [Paenibacillus campinasensis]PAD72875.1 hypothetical protein CHH67_21455 [Paenibacillus campinasensis]
MSNLKGDEVTYSLNLHSKEIQTVGKLDIEAIDKLTGIRFPESEVKMYPGAIKHILKKHPGILEKHGHLIPNMISNPDYIGQNPKVPDSIELIKVINPHLLLAIKLDPTGYLFLSSFYELDNGEVKVSKRLGSGRLVPYKSTMRASEAS